ncbi:hypothetical protein EDD85DRAFT_975177 [Armillaria nabsnona]|nr:hypothetical protein EDD85DRAFT_975177 [Armillaria nabsnona]
MSGIDSCLKIAKLTAAAGEFAPFPFIKGAAECVVVVLETIESAAKNRQDLQELAEGIVTTLVVVRNTIIDHGPTSASCFKDICLDFQTYLDNLLSKLNKETKLRGIRRLLKAKKISEDISAYRKQVQAAKEDFLIRTTTMTRLALSDVHDEVTTGFSTLTGSVETSERNITSTIRDNFEEIRTWGVRQSEDMQNLSAGLQGSLRRGLYKGSVWNIVPGDIHIIEPVTRSSTKCRAVRYQDSYCTIENSDTRKVIRKYQTSGRNREDPMKQLDQALDFFMKQRHPNLPQIFGICRSPDLPAIIFLLHGTNQIPFHHYLCSLPATQFTQFFSELFQDLQFWLGEPGGHMGGSGAFLGQIIMGHGGKSGSVSIDLSWDDVIRKPITIIHTPRKDSSGIEKSWIAQTSKLDSCLRSRGYGDDLNPCITNVQFYIHILPKDKDNDFCHICNAKDRYHHALSLSITAPVIDYETNIITSWPVISCSRVCGMDSLKEDDIFTIEVTGYYGWIQWKWFWESMVRSNIPELNAEHGFDPARDGTDVCEYFGWPFIEFLDPSTGEWMLISQSSEPVSVISDNTSPILSQERNSAPRGMDVATGSITEEVQAGEAPTKTESVSVVRHDISTRALIIIFIAISIQIILLSSFKNYL